jgi:hypothetical protein
MSLHRAEYALPLALTLVLGLCQAVIGADTSHCDQCGCHQVRKVTRLVKTCKTIRIPKYEKNQESAFFPKKGMVPYCEKRCEPNYEICGHVCKCERCIERHAPCEEITHVVKKNECKDGTVCTKEVHHDKYYDYQLSFTHRVQITSNPTVECQTNYGATSRGCFKDVCLPSPTGDHCECTVPEVRWVTFHVCSGCSHCWPAGESIAE